MRTTLKSKSHVPTSFFFSDECTAAVATNTLWKKCVSGWNGCRSHAAQCASRLFHCISSSATCRMCITLRALVSPPVPFPNPDYPIWTFSLRQQPHHRFGHACLTSFRLLEKDVSEKLFSPFLSNCWIKVFCVWGAGSCQSAWYRRQVGGVWRKQRPMASWLLQMLLLLGLFWATSVK